jgi:hypothetical protein
MTARCGHLLPVAPGLTGININIRAATEADVSAMHAVRMSVRENRLSNPEQITETSYLPYIAAGSAWVAEADGNVPGRQNRRRGCAFPKEA